LTTQVANLFIFAISGWQLIASLVVFYIPLVQQVANLHVMIDLSGCQQVGNPKKLQTSWQLVGNPGCQPGLATSFQLVRVVGCGLKGAFKSGSGSIWEVGPATVKARSPSVD